MLFKLQNNHEPLKTSGSIYFTDKKYLLTLAANR
jgi:hypothetical protein